MPDGPGPTGATADALDGFCDALLDDGPEALYERAPCGYLTTGPGGDILKVNQTFLTLTGYARDDLVGKRTFSDLLTGGGRIYHETHYAPMLQMQGTAREIALDLVRADGTRLPVLVNSVLERDRSGAPRVVRTAVFDATERRAYERELLRAKERAEESEARATLLARTLQQALMPPAPPVVPGLDVAAVYRAAGNGEEIGGDFYDVFEVAPGDWAVALGDVCGKGVDAAAVTALARHTIRAAAVTHRSPSSILATLNDVLLHHDSDRFCTVVLLRLRRRDDGWRGTIASGGHELPLVRTPPGQPTPAGSPGSLLGVFPDAEFADTDLDLPPGTEVLAFTDGVTEARRGIEFFGPDRVRLSAEAHGGGARSLAEGLLADVMAFQGELPRDDIAVVAVRVP